MKDVESIQMLGLCMAVQKLLELDRTHFPAIVATSLYGLL